MNNDKTLARAVLAGDTEVFEKIVEIHYPKLIGYLFKMGFSSREGEELACRIFSTAYRNLPRYDDSRDFSLWLYRIAVGYARNYRRKNRHKANSVPDIPDFLRAPGTGANRALEEESLNSILSAVHDESRSLLILHYYNGFSLKETGQLYGMSADSARIMISRAREILLQNIDLGDDPKNKCRYNENSIIKYLYGELELSEQTAFKNHLRTCWRCRIMLESDNALLERVKNEIPFGEIPVERILEKIGSNALVNHKPGLREFFLSPRGFKRLWRFAVPAFLAILLAAILAVPNVFSSLWGGIMTVFNKPEPAVVARAEENIATPPVEFSKASGLSAGSQLVGTLNERGMGDVPWQVLYADPNQVLIRNSNTVAGFRDGGLYQVADLDGMNLNHPEGPVVTEFSTSPTGSFLIAGNSINGGDASGENPGVYLFNAANGDYLKISELFFNQVAFGWSLGGNYLAYVDKSNGETVSVLDLKTLALTKLSIQSPVKSLFVSNSGGVSVFTGDQVMMASLQDAGWKTETVDNEPFYMDYDSSAVWYVINGAVTRHTMGSEPDTVMKLESPVGSEDPAGTFITNYRIEGSFLAYRLKNGDAGLLNLRTSAMSYLSTNREVEPDILPFCDATSSGKRLMLDNGGKFLILSGNDVTTANIPGYSALTPSLTRWMDDQRIAYVRMVDEKAPMAGEFTLCTIDTVTGDIAEVFRSVGKDLAQNTPEPGNSDSLSTKTGGQSDSGRLYETDKATGTRIESLVVTSCKVKSGPGEKYADIGEAGKNDVIIYNSRVVNGWCLAQKLSGLLDYNDKTRNAFWIKADNIWLYDRYSLPAGIITADEVTLSRASLVKGNLIRIILKGDTQSFVIPDTIDINMGITGWIDNGSFTQEFDGAYYNQAYLKKGSTVYSSADSQSEVVRDFTDFMASAQRDAFVNLSGQSEGGFAYVMLPGGMSGWVNESDVHLPGGGDSSAPAEPGSGDTDLNGDGAGDKITFSTDGARYTLTVNNSSAEGSGEEVQQKFKLVDIDPSDGFIELVVEEYGPSDDYFSTFYYYDGQSLSLIGKVQGLCGNSDEVTGDGIVHSQTRGNVLETWFYNSDYYLNGQHMLVQAPQAFNEKIRYKDSTPLKLLIPELPFSGDTSGNSIAFVLKQGETVWFVGSDNSGWCLFETMDGKQGWLQISGFQDIPLAGLTAGEVFEGLVSAD